MFSKLRVTNECLGDETNQESWVLDLNSYRLDSVCDFINGGAWSDTEYAPSGIHVVKVTNLSDGRIIRRDDNYLPLSKFEEYKQHELRSGDIVVSTVGSHPTQPGSVVGRVALVSGEFSGSFLNQNAACLRVIKPNLVSQRYLFYLANTVLFKHHIESRARGSANQVRMAIGELKKFEVQYPSATEQKKVAAILSAYDELIEINQRRIALLEKMAEEIYREWFVRLRFPDHEKVQFVKGVPEGWKILPFSEIVNINPSERLDKSEEVPFVGMEDLSLNSMFFAVKEHRKGASGSKFRNRDVLFPRITPSVENGKRGVVMTLADGQVGCGSTEFIVMREKVIGPEHIYFLTCSPEFRKHAELSMTGASGRQRVQEDCFSFFLVKTPPHNVRLQFAEVMSPHFAQIQLLSLQNESLAKSCDMLLPRLISGKLSVENLDIQFPPGMEEPAHET